MLENVSLFNKLGESERKALSEQMVSQVYPKNTVVICEGDASDSLFVMLTGRVKVYLSDDEGKEIILDTHEPGDYFGEVVMFDDEPRSASVVTLEKSKLGMITKTNFEKCMLENPQIAIEVIRGLITRLRRSTENVRSLALLDVYGRVARLMLDLAEETEGVLMINEPLTQQDIADRVGSSREMISRIFKDLKIGGYIEIKDKKIIIKEQLPHAW